MTINTKRLREIIAQSGMPSALAVEAATIVADIEHKAEALRSAVFNLANDMADSGNANLRRIGKAILEGADEP